MALDPHVIDHAVVTELSPPPPVVIPVDPRVRIVAYKASVNVLEVGDVVAGQGNRTVGDSTVPSHRQICRDLPRRLPVRRRPAPPSGPAPTALGFRSSHSSRFSTGDGQRRTVAALARRLSSIAEGSWHGARSVHNFSSLSRIHLGRRTSKLPGRLPLTRHLRGETARGRRRMKKFTWGILALGTGVFVASLASADCPDQCPGVRFTIHPLPDRQRPTGSARQDIVVARHIAG